VRREGVVGEGDEMFESIAGRGGRVAPDQARTTNPDR
jgi:hypothetical protein